MTKRSRLRQTVRFESFELDLGSGELRKGGVKVRLQDQPFQVLRALLERHGEVVSREELQQIVWPSETFVDFEDGLSTAVHKIRNALRDSAAKPRFIETLPKRGYRFIAPIETNEEDNKDVGAPVVQPTEASGNSAKPANRVLALVLSALAVVAAAMLAFWPRGVSEAPPNSFEAVPITSYPGTERYPSFSPDGRQVAFSWDGPNQDNADIYVKLIGPGDPLRLTTDPAQDLTPVWSPDGRWIAFVRVLREGVGNVILVPALGGAERKLAESVYSVSFGPFLEWTPDSLGLLIPNAASGASSIVLVSIETGEGRELFSSTGLHLGDYFPAISSDGRQLAFTREMDVYLTGLSEDFSPIGEALRVIFDPQETAMQKTWTADGRQIVFSRYPSTTTLRRLSVRPEGGIERGIAVPGSEVAHPVISRQGDRLAYTRGLVNHNIWRAEIGPPGEAAEPPTPVIASSFRDQSPQFSPDGNRIAFASARSGSMEIWLAESNGARPLQLTDFGAGHRGSPSWSPDGAAIAFDGRTPDGDYGIYVVDASGGKPRFLIGSSSIPHWSRDGEWIYFDSLGSERRSLWKIPAIGGEAERVIRDGRAGWESPDGEFFYYLKGRPAGELWKMPVGGGEHTYVLDVDGTHHSTASDKGVYFYRANEPSQESGAISFHSFATGEAHTLVRLEKPLSTGLSVSPDGRWVIYAQVDERGSDLMLVENFR